MRQASGTVVTEHFLTVFRDALSIRVSAIHRIQLTMLFLNDACRLDILQAVPTDTEA